jgi:hypothetical protein
MFHLSCINQIKIYIINEQMYFIYSILPIMFRNKKLKKKYSLLWRDDEMASDTVSVILGT